MHRNEVRNLNNAEGFNERAIQSDVKKDVEFFGFLPMLSVAVGLPVFVFSLACAGMMFYFFGLGVIGFLLLSLLPALAVIIFFKIDVPWRFKRALEYKLFNKKKNITLNDLHDIKSIDGPFITYTDGSKAVLLEYESGTAWDNATFDLKYNSIRAFSIMLPTVLKDKNIEITVYATVAKEDTSMFIAKRKSLKRCKTPEIRKMTEARFEHHAEIENQDASKTKYVIRIRTESSVEQLKKSLKTIRGFMEKGGANIVLYGKDIIEDYMEKQLIPLSPKIRGKIVIEKKKKLFNFDIKSKLKEALRFD